MKIAIITGASSGMGEQFALQLKGKLDIDELWIIARRADRLSSLAEKTGLPTRVIAADLLEPNSFSEIKNLLGESKPDVKLLVNAAGFGYFGDFINVPVEEDFKMIDLNCKALLHMTRIVLPFMSDHSFIINVDSQSAFQPVPYITTYGATKAFVLSYSKAIHQELKSRDITVTAVCPGWVKTEFFDTAFSTNSNKRVQNFAKIYTPDDVVKTAYKDALVKKKDISIHGLPVKLDVLGAKLMPNWLTMKVWFGRQKTPKNDDKLN